MSESPSGELAMPMVGAPPSLTVDFCGETYLVGADSAFGIGRDADLTLDDNPFLHRRFLELRCRGGLWWLSNVGSLLSATVSDRRGAMQAWLSAGAALPVVFDHTIVWFTAGPTTYQFDLLLGESLFMQSAGSEVGRDGTVTIGHVALTPDQHLLLVGLCEQFLVKGPGAGAVLPSTVVADRLGWTLTKFNRKLDNVAQKLAALGVRGLHGDSERLASSRRARLIEYALAAQIVKPEHLALLPSRDRNSANPPRHR